MQGSRCVSPMKMCSTGCEFCTTYKIRLYKPHLVEDCPIKSAAYCSHCASYGLHFTKDCHNKPLRRRKDQPIYQGVPAEKPSNALVINDDMECVYSYLKLWGKDIRPKGYADKTVKKILVEEAAARGYEGVRFM